MADGPNDVLGKQAIAGGVERALHRPEAAHAGWPLAPQKKKKKWLDELERILERPDDLDCGVEVARVGDPLRQRQQWRLVGPRRRNELDRVEADADDQIRVAQRLSFDGRSGQEAGGAGRALRDHSLGLVRRQDRAGDAVQCAPHRARCPPSPHADRDDRGARFGNKLPRASFVSVARGGGWRHGQLEAGVHVDVDVYRAGGRSARHLDRGRDCLVGSVWPYRDRPLRHRLEERLLVEALVRDPRGLARAHGVADDQHRSAVEQRLRHAVDGTGCTRTARDDAGSGSPGELAVGGGHDRGRGLATREHEVETRALAGGVVAERLGADGPFPFPVAVFDPRQAGRVTQSRPVMLASAGYFGHMWELYAMWAWFSAFMVDDLTERGWSDPTSGASPR